MEGAAVAAMFAALIAARVSDGSIPYFSEGVVGVSVVGILLLLWKIQRSVIRPLSERADKLERAMQRERLDHRLSDWRLSEVAKIVRASGIDIPDEVMYGRPAWYAVEAEGLDK